MAMGARRVATGIIKVIVIITVTVDIIVIVIVTANVIVIIGGIVGITDIVMVSLFVSLSSELPLRLSFVLVVLFLNVLVLPKGTSPRHL